MLAFPSQSMVQSRDRITQTMPTGPTGIENDKVDAIDGKRPMILKATAKIWTVE
jgi:hypothetical protein